MDDKAEEIGNILIYQNESGDTKIDVYFEDDDVWMSQKSISQLYQTTLQNVGYHITNIYSDGELDARETIKDYLIVRNEGGRQVERPIKHYNFKMILAIGYRVRSHVGVHFRNWASNVLTEYSRKGFALNDERLKDPKPFGGDYFDELLERIRDIRASEKRFYSKIREIFATSVDYDSKAKQAQVFFATAQNKMHYSIHGHTAAELIAERADSSKPNMGLTNFKGAVVRKTDVDTAKNYLNQEEIENLNRLVTMYLDFAEDQARRNIPMYMADWEKKLDEFLLFTGREVLDNPGKISAEDAKQTAEQEFQKYEQHRHELEHESDMDILNQDIKKIGKEKRNL
ncbi:hypothetical protein MmiAt1_03330 [Methanimicrococcus sp. At1]|uniref:Hydroxyacid dehydrogenase n=1 Tax=Methanimicrococcus hacksteinii TaxID=3028293 RepID=A0ABU3VN06_9EURY|nr:virulence RhuM family protein [Methanimicrococcus sp. At1]MDV0444793.1 hypothetical protein [Methanimicrococcus sp. At1]